MRGTEIGDDSIGCIAGIASIRALDIGSTRVSDSGLAKLQGLKELKKLDLFVHTYYRRRSAIPGQLCPELESLCLQQTKITDSSVPVLGGLRKLDHLDVRTTRMTYRGKRELRRLLPACKLEE